MQTKAPVSWTQLYEQWFSEIYTQESERLKNLAVRIMHNEIEAEKILGESFAVLATELTENPHRFTSIEHAKGYLVITIRNRCCSWLRKKRPVTVFELKEEIHDDNDPTLSKIEKQDYMGHLLELINKLPPKLHKVASLFFKDGLTNEEIAIQLQLDKKSLFVYKSRALKKLQEMALAGNYM